MIGKLKGILELKEKDHLLIDVQGVGYLVSCSTFTLNELPACGTFISLFIEMYVREESLRLFGFLTEIERDWFRLLQTVQGVGARVALVLLGHLPPSQLGPCLLRQDKALLSKVPGIGPKLALRLITELKDKIAPLLVSLPPNANTSSSPETSILSSSDPSSLAAQEALAALLKLGYGRTEALNALMTSLEQNGEQALTTPLLIRLSLKHLGK